MHAQRMPPHITTPFDDSAAMRLRRMGLLTPDGTPDERIIRPLAYVSAGLYYDQLCDSVESHESAAGVCQHIISEEAENRPRQALLALSMSYDAMRRGLPDTIGNEFVKMIFVSFLNSNIYLLKKRLTSRVGIFLETPYSKASSHFPIASH